MSDRPPVTALVTRAANGDQRAWDALVERYAPLIWSICRRYQLGGADADDVGQTVWFQLLDHLGELRGRPWWPAGWPPPPAGNAPGPGAKRGNRRLPGKCWTPRASRTRRPRRPEQELLAAERDALLREAFTRLPYCCQQLIALLTGDQPLSYAQISAQLGIPAGSIGPRRGRCLGKLRRDPAIAALLNPAAASMQTEPHRRAPVRQ